MLLHKIEKQLKKSLVFVTFLLFISASFISYSTQKSVAVTFKDNQTKASLSDDLFNSCTLRCPSQSQSLQKAVVPLHHFAYTTGATAPPKSVLITNTIILLFVLIIFYFATHTYVQKTSRQKLFCVWRD